MTSISPINLAQVSATTSSQVADAADSGLTFSSATPAAPGSGVAGMVDLFSSSTTAANAAQSKTSLYLGMLHLPVIALDNGDDDDD